MRQIIMASLAAALAGCRSVVPELTQAGEYYVDNKTACSLLVQADSMGAPLTLSDSIAAPGSGILIYRVTERTGGSLYPSQFLTDIRVFAQTGGSDSLIYRGISNADWQHERLSDLNTRLTLRIR